MKRWVYMQTCSASFIKSFVDLLWRLIGKTLELVWSAENINLYSVIDFISIFLSVDTEYSCVNYESFNILCVTSPTKLLSVIILKTNFLLFATKPFVRLKNSATKFTPFMWLRSSNEFIFVIQSFVCQEQLKITRLSDCGNRFYPGARVNFVVALLFFVLLSTDQFSFWFFLDCITRQFSRTTFLKASISISKRADCIEAPCQKLGCLCSSCQSHNFNDMVSISFFLYFSLARLGSPLITVIATQTYTRD